MEEEELSISELFGLDPLALTLERVDRVVEKYRSQREQFAAGVKPERAKRAKAPDPTLLDLD